MERLKIDIDYEQGLVGVSGICNQINEDLMEHMAELWLEEPYLDFEGETIVEFTAVLHILDLPKLLELV